MMIFVLIAGSYTPVCLVVLGGRMGYTLLAVVWGIAVVGMVVKACWAKYDGAVKFILQALLHSIHISLCSF